MKKTLLCLCLFFIISSAFSQNFTGKIVDSTGNGIPFSTIQSGNIGTTTDENGNFKMTLSIGTHTIKISNIEYEPFEEIIQISDDLAKPFQFQLKISDNQLEEVMVVGQRSQPRSAVGTALPIDNLNLSDISSTGQSFQLSQALQYRIPSFNTTQSPVSDAASFYDSQDIRGQGSGRTLLLINGKRKNFAAQIYMSNGPSIGETASDFSSIPVDAIKSIEILRDGASAQYGSDAIAGVVNIKLNDKFKFSHLRFSNQITSQGDGFISNLSFSSGKNFKKNGYFLYTLEYLHQTPKERNGLVDVEGEIRTFGGTPEKDAGIRAFIQDYPTGLNRNGTGSSRAFRTSINFGSGKLNSGAEIYANGNFSNRYFISYANYRAPYNRLDFGLLHTTDPNKKDYTGLGGIYHGYIGYLPTFEGALNDFNTTIGLKNKKNGWNQDYSFSTGGSSIHIFVNNSVNRSLGINSPTSFDSGGYSFYNFIFNTDFSKSILDNLSIGLGSEIRLEKFNIIAGEPKSYEGEGTNSYPGHHPQNAGNFERKNIGLYADLNWNYQSNGSLNFTTRMEGYSDFGKALVGKISILQDLVDKKLSFRGSLSTGFKAPSLQQAYLQAITNNFSGGNVVIQGLFRNNSDVLKTLGINPLSPENSVNISFGLTSKIQSNFEITADFYSIKINNRIILIPAINKPTNVNSRLYEIFNANNIELMQFFTNGLNTLSQGIDFVSSYKNIRIGKGYLDISLAGNTTINRKVLGEISQSTFFDEEGIKLINAETKSIYTTVRPNYKWIQGFDYELNNWTINFTSTLIGETIWRNISDIGEAFNHIQMRFIPNSINDLTISKKFYQKKLTIGFTVNNLFNRIPIRKFEAIDAIGKTILNDPNQVKIIENGLTFNGKYGILTNGSGQFNQYGTIFLLNLSYQF